MSRLRGNACNVRFVIDLGYLPPSGTHKNNYVRRHPTVIPYIESTDLGEHNQFICWPYSVQTVSTVLTTCVHLVQLRKLLNKLTRVRAQHLHISLLRAVTLKGVLTSCLVWLYHSIVGCCQVTGYQAWCRKSSTLLSVIFQLAVDDCHPSDAIIWGSHLVNVICDNKDASSSLAWAPSDLTSQRLKPVKIGFLHRSLHAHVVHGRLIPGSQRALCGFP